MTVQRGWPAALAGSGLLCILVLLASTAPPQVRAEPLEAVVRDESAVGASLPSLLAATSKMAATVREGDGERVEFSFVDGSNRPVATWASTRKDAPRLVCTACPTPIVGDVDGFYAWTGSGWEATDVVDAPTSSPSDPLTAIFGVIQESATRISLPLLLGRDGRYLLVDDGGARFATSATGIRPSVGDHVDLANGPGQTSAPLAVVRDPSGSVISLQTEVLTADGASTLRVATEQGTRTEDVRGPRGAPTANSAPCRRLSVDAPIAVSVAVQPLRGPDATVPELAVLWLDADLAETGRTELSGHYDHCLVRPDGSVLLWTGTTAGAAAVDVAVVRPGRVVETTTISIAEDALANTLLSVDGGTASLVAWPLGKKALRIDEAFATHPLDAVGGSQALGDDAGGTWVSFSSVDVVHRFPLEASR